MIIETENLRKVYRTDVVETTAVDGLAFTLSDTIVRAGGVPIPNPMGLPWP